MASALGIKPPTSVERTEFYERLSRKNATPLWEVLSSLVTPVPRTPAVPAIWRYSEMRPLLLEAGGVITAEEAERRVLVLENPALRGMSQATGSLYAGIQLVLPGEVAGTHRHAASALRFVLESEGGFTAVDGEKTTMKFGDLVVNPPWAWHDHGNPGEKPAIWMDVLDLPIVNLLSASFAEHYEATTQPILRPERDAYARYGANLLPIDYEPEAASSPVFSYPYARTREVLDELQGNGPVHACHGIKLRFTNPATGGSPLPTIGTFIQLLPAGFAGAEYRSTDATIYCIVEGEGETRIGDTTFTWGRRDIFVAPSWQPISHKTSGEAVLFSASDRPVQQALGLWRGKAGS
jgi:gentisate 1,2-dioxygenase